MAARRAWANPAVRTFPSSFRPRTASISVVALSAETIPWQQQVGARLKAYAGFKSIAMCSLMAGFFACYFLLLKFPVFSVTEMPVTALDRWIVFQPAALPLYLSLWVYISLAPGLLDRKDELLAYYLAMIGLAGVGLAVFFFWPTAVPPSGIDWLQHPATAQLKGSDGAGNACPSLHVAFAVFTALQLHRLLRQVGARGWVRLLNAGWCLGILYSTLATKQHVALDVFAGSALGLAGVFLASRFPMGQHLGPRADPALKIIECEKWEIRKNPTHSP